jgi:hypothetical protein
MKMSLFILLIPFVVQAEQSTTKTTSCYQLKSDKALAVTLSSYDDSKQEMVKDPSRKLLGLKAKLVEEHSGRILTLKAKIERSLRKGSKGSMGSHKKKLESYEAYLICENETNECFGECDGGRIQLTVQDKSLLSFTSEGVRFLDCGGSGKELWLATLQQLNLTRTSKKTCKF